MSWAVIGDAAMVKVMAAAEAYVGDSEEAINRVLHEEAGPLIYIRINPLIHPSGRTFKGHRASATASHWQEYRTGENLAVTVAAEGAYRYLYFPDDGSSSRRHAGNQQFFKRGGEAAVDEIAERCMAALRENWS